MITTMHPERPPSTEMKDPQIDEAGLETNGGKQSRAGRLRGPFAILERHGEVEVRGAAPVPYDERTETSYSKVFTLWFCMSCNPLP